MCELKSNEKIIVLFHETKSEFFRKGSRIYLPMDIKGAGKYEKTISS